MKYTILSAKICCTARHPDFHHLSRLLGQKRQSPDQKEHLVVPAWFRTKEVLVPMHLRMSGRLALRKALVHTQQSVQQDTLQEVSRVRVFIAFHAWAEGATLEIL